MRRPKPDDMAGNVQYFMRARYRLSVDPEAIGMLRDQGFTFPLEDRPVESHNQVQESIPSGYGMNRQTSHPILHANLIALSMPFQFVKKEGDSDLIQNWHSWLGLACFFLGKSGYTTPDSQSRLYRDGTSNLTKSCPDNRLVHLSEMHLHFGSFRRAFNTLDGLERRVTTPVSQSKVLLSQGVVLTEWGRSERDRGRETKSEDQSRIHSNAARDHFNNAIPPLAKYLDLVEDGSLRGEKPAKVGTAHGLLGNCYLELGDYAKAVEHGEVSLSFNSFRLGDCINLTRSYPLLATVVDEPQKLEVFGKAIDMFERVTDEIRAAPSVLRSSSTLAHAIDHIYEEGFESLHVILSGLSGVHHTIEELRGIVKKFEAAYRRFEQILQAEYEAESGNSRVFRKLLNENGAFIDRVDVLRTEFNL